MTKIYKLIHNGEIVYVGKTTYKLLSKRKSCGYAKNEQLHKISKECTIELIEETDDITRENYWIDLLRSEGHPLLNKRGGDTGLDTKEYYKEYQKEYKEKLKEYRKEYREKNKEKRKEYSKEYYLKKKSLKDTSQ